MEHPGGVSETTGTLVLMTLAGDTEDTEDTEKSSNTLNVDRMEDPDANQRQAEITSKCTAVIPVKRETKQEISELTNTLPCPPQ